jgi:hypothetical protein
MSTDVGARENGEMPAMEPVRARYSEHSHAPALGAMIGRRCLTFESPWTVWRPRRPWGSRPLDRVRKGPGIGHMPHTGPIWLAVRGCATSPFEPLGRLSWDNLPLKRRGAFRLRCARDFNVGLLCKNLIRHPFCLQPSTNKETGPLDVSGKLQRCLQYR